MIYSENAINILTVKTYKGIGGAWIVKNLKGNENEDVIVSLLNCKYRQTESITIDDFKSRKNEIEEKLHDFKNICDGLIAIGDKNFPQYRGNVKQSEQPIFLFYKGDIDLLNINNNNITVIGLLNPDETIESRERKVAEEIIKQDITIVSGLAFGCDSIAHQQAMIGGKTIAILPSPLNDILPAKNNGLACEIVEKGGLLITEYYEKFKSKMELSSRYKERDRLQALFCDTIILAASYAQDSATRWNMYDKKLDSGARLAMEYAKNYKIPRAVIYNENTDINNPMFDLNRQLINEGNDVTILTTNNLKKIINKIKESKRNKLHKIELLNLFDK
ncbi:MAG: DNA-binding protein [Bacteroidia bacterium]|nr:DNA-binding protein [Bacteroidia bacterium]